MKFIILEALETVVTYETSPRSGTVRFAINGANVANRLKMQRDAKKVLQSMVNTAIGDDELIVYEQGEGVVVEVYDFLVNGKEAKYAKQLENALKANDERDVFSKMTPNEVIYTITNVTAQQKSTVESTIFDVLDKEFNVDRKMVSMDYREGNMVVEINKNVVLGKEDKVLDTLQNAIKLPSQQTKV